MREVSLGANERLDDLMKSGRHIIQNTQEFCFSLDAVLLAHFLSLKSRQKVLELGTGTGVIPLLIADEVARVDAVELNPVMAELAARNVRLNELEDKIFVREGDYRAIRELYKPESFDIVLANPPYRPVGEGQANKLTGVARARHEFTAT
ncbi:MAG: methyltransferase, partial [Selenomonas sp.]|nr:methyltransferase [Selenomonas sp.]